MYSSYNFGCELTFLAPNFGFLIFFSNMIGEQFESFKLKACVGISRCIKFKWLDQLIPKKEIKYLVKSSKKCIKKI